jgi:hypothetical protein
MKPGAQIMQDVPLPDDEKIRTKSHVRGVVVSVAQAEGDGGIQVSLRFDQYHSSLKRIPSWRAGPADEERDTCAGKSVSHEVADLMVTDCAELYVPAPGLNVGVATVMT